MDDEFSSWLCYVKLLVCNPDKNSCQSDLVYCSLPAKVYQDLLGFENEKLKIIAIFNFHPMNRCAIAEIDEPEQIKALIKVLMIEDNLLNFTIGARRFIRRFNLVAYYGYDVETAMQIAANKQVDIILLNAGYSGKYNDRQVDWMEIIQMLKSNPETAKIPVILKMYVRMSGMYDPVIVSDLKRSLFTNGGADDAIEIHSGDPGYWELLVEKIKYNLPKDDPSPNTKINLKKRFSGSRTIKVQKEKESVLDFLAFKIFQLIILTASLFVPLIDAISRRDKSSRK